MGIRLIKHLKYWIHCLLQVIYNSDDICVACSEVSAHDRLICSNCIKTIKSCEEEFVLDKLSERFTYYAVAYYSGIIPELILRLKYKNDFRSGEALAELMVDVVKEKSINFELICFVPISVKSFKKRGYNQSEYLAKVIGNRLNVPVVNCLKKVKETKDQIGLSGIMRWSNLVDCFQVTENKKIRAKNLLLIDDVITTGATAFHCASTLINNGAEKVTILTAAKSRI